MHAKLNDAISLIDLYKCLCMPSSQPFTPFSASLRLGPVLLRHQTPTDEGLSEGHVVDRMSKMDQNAHLANKSWKHDSILYIVIPK